MSSFFRSLLTVMLLLSGAGAAKAAPIYFQVNIDTSTISGTAGYLDFTLAGGIPMPPDGVVTIMDFFSDGVLGAAQLSGGALGDLSSQVTLDNSSFPPSEYYTPFAFGHTLTFLVMFSGPAVTNPDGVSGSSTFAFSMLDMADPPNPLLLPDPLPGNDPGGFAFTVDLNNDGSTTVNNFMGAGQITPAAPPGAVPEPNMSGAVAACIAAIAASRFRRRSVH